MDRNGPVGVLLAGGLARRMGGGDKGLRLLGGRTLLDHVIARLAPQVRCLVLNANGDPARFAAWGLPVAADPVPDHPGPLAGLLAGMEWARRHCPEASDIVTAPTDTPFLPADLVARLAAAREAAGAPIAWAESAGRVHPVVGLWPVRLAGEVAAALARGKRRIRDWGERQGAVAAGFGTEEPGDPFLNVNRPEDLEAAERHLNRADREKPGAGAAEARFAHGERHGSRVNRH